MAKCCFKVYMNDGINREIVPATLGDSNTELSDFDNFVYKSGGYLELCNLLANELKVEAGKIREVKILQIRGSIEFSTIFKNPYLMPVLDSVARKVLNDYNDYPLNTIVVDRENDSYKDMVNYLFKNLEEDSDNFFEQVYKYNNEFVNLLNKYTYLCKQVAFRYDDLRELNTVKNKILTGLSIYKNYRGLCKARYEYENRYTFGLPRNNNNQRPVIEIKPRNVEFDPTHFPQEPLHEVNQYVNDLGEEKEEFLEYEELESEDCYGKRR